MRTIFHRCLITTRIGTIVVVGVLLIFGQRRVAGGVVNTIVTSTDANPVTVDVTQRDLRETTQDIGNSQGVYAPLANRPYTALYSIAGAKDVLQLSSNAAGND